MKKCVMGLAMLIAFAGLGRADDSPAAVSKFYKLLFVVQEIDGTNIVSRREYDTTAATNPSGGCSVRTSSRITLPNGPNQVQNYSLDVNIDASGLQEMSTGLSLTIMAGINSLSQEPASGTDHGPIVRTNSWKTTLMIPTRKPTVIFSSDDLTSKHKMQLVLTATPVS